MASYMQFKRIKIVQSIKRLHNSKDGNPRFEFTFSNGERMKTAANVMWAFAIVPDRLVGRPIAATFHYTRSGCAVLDGVA